MLKIMKQFFSSSFEAAGNSAFQKAQRRNNIGELRDFKDFRSLAVPRAYAPRVSPAMRNAGLGNM